MGTDYDFIGLMTKIIDIFNCKAGAMDLPAKTNPLIGYEEKAGVLGIKMVFTLLVSPDCQADRSNGQNHIFSLSKDELAGLLKKVGVNIRDRVKDLGI